MNNEIILKRRLYKRVPWLFEPGELMLGITGDFSVNSSEKNGAIVYVLLKEGTKLFHIEECIETEFKMRLLQIIMRRGTIFVF